MAAENDPVQQIIAYQRRIYSQGGAPDLSPRALMIARVREAGALSKLLEVTFDLWYPLVSAFEIDLKLPGERPGPPMPAGGHRQAPAFPLLDLAGASLAGASFAEFDLIGLDLQHSDLQGANLAEADLSWANLSGANLSRANLTGAQLFEADLRSACLGDANLTGANLTGARYNRETHWPAGFDPRMAGALLAG